MRRYWRTLLPALAVADVLTPWALLYHHNPAPPSVMQRADQPAMRTVGQTDGRWLALHEAYTQRARAGGIEILFLGDSLTHGWLQQPFWREQLRALGAVNFGIGGDRTQHLAWRLLHGEMEMDPPPRACVLQIGTNNVDSDAAEEVVRGIAAIVQLLRSRWPDSVLLLLGLFPRGVRADNPLRERVRLVNQGLRELVAAHGASGELIFVDAAALMPLLRDGSLDLEFTLDYVHLTNEMYARLGAALIEQLSQLRVIEGDGGWG